MCFVSHRVFVHIIIRNISFFSLNGLIFERSFRNVCMWHTVCGGFWDSLAQTCTINFTIRYIGAYIRSTMKFLKNIQYLEGAEFPDHVLMSVTVGVKVRVNPNLNPNPNPFLTRQQPFLTRQQFFKKWIHISYRPPPYSGCSLAPTSQQPFKL